MVQDPGIKVFVNLQQRALTAPTGIASTSTKEITKLPQRCHKFLVSYMLEGVVLSLTLTENAAILLHMNTSDLFIRLQFSVIGDCTMRSPSSNQLVESHVRYSGLRFQASIMTVPPPGRSGEHINHIDGLVGHTFIAALMGLDGYLRSRISKNEGATDKLDSAPMRIDSDEEFYPITPSDYD